MNIKKIAAAAVPAFLVLGIAAAALAEIPNVPEGPQTVEALFGLGGPVDRVVNLLFTVLLVASVIFIILAAFQFIAGGGDPNAVVQARQKLIWAVVGIVVALLARSIPKVIQNFLIPR